MSFQNTQNLWFHYVQWGFRLSNKKDWKALFDSDLKRLNDGVELDTVVEERKVHIYSSVDVKVAGLLNCRHCDCVLGTNPNCEYCEHKRDEALVPGMS